MSNFYFPNWTDVLAVGCKQFVIITVNDEDFR
jgi:hypothetical protein